MVNREPGTPGLETHPKRDQERRMGAEQCPPEPDPARDVLQASPAPQACGDQRVDGAQQVVRQEKAQLIPGAAERLVAGSNRLTIEVLLQRRAPPGPTDIRPHGSAGAEKRWPGGRRHS